MKVLLDTNIIIHREASRVQKYDIGQLFYWLDKLHFEKYIHPITPAEIKRYQDEGTVKTFDVKLESYNRIRYPLPLAEPVKLLSNELDKNENDINDTSLLNEVYEGSVDILITEDKKIHSKAKRLGIADRVLKIQSFLEKVISENPELVDYKVLAVRKVDFGQVDLQDSFFESFREDYAEFNRWFRKKANKDECYVCYSENALTAFLYVKVEGPEEDHSQITPILPRKKRLKIGTLKVIANGYKIGERFLKIVFDNAFQYGVDEIYVTVFDKREEQHQLIEMLKEWGFYEHGIKTTPNGDELVLVRPFSKKLPPDINNPKLTYPFFSWDTRKFIIKIEPQYHTELFPDSINTRENKEVYIDNEVHRNRIGKVYISHAKDRNLSTGDIVIIYRMGETKPKKYSSTVTSICIVEEVKDGFNSFEEFYQACNRRTMIGKDDLYKNWWNRFSDIKPFVIKFLFAYSFPTPKPTLHDLNILGVIPDIMNMPRGFIEIDKEQFRNLVKFAYKKK